MKKHFLLASIALLAAMPNVLAETGTLGNTQTVCQSSTYEYDVDPISTNADYEWEVGGTQGTDRNLTYIDNTHKTKAQIQWITAAAAPGRDLKTREISPDGCVGPWKESKVIVNPKPVVANQSNNICSDDQAGTSHPDKVNLSFVTSGTPTITKWNIKSINVPTGVDAGSGNAVTGDTTNADAIKNDVYTNTTNAAKNVTYTITPYAGDCAGDDFTVTVTVYPSVSEPTVKFRSI